jgi:hypothetical protein
VCPHRCARARHASAWSLRADCIWYGMVVASGWQGVVGELVGTTRRALGNRSGAGAHRGQRSTVRWGWWLGAAACGVILTRGRVGSDSG